MQKVYISVDHFPACDLVGGDAFWRVEVRDCSTSTPVHADTLFAFAHCWREVTARTDQIERQVDKYHPEMQVVFIE